MQKMQVTFNNVMQSPSHLDIQDHLSTLTFQIEYRGKSYDCVGHVRQRVDSHKEDDSRILFSGYYGYNGPINIQKLRDAALDYYTSMSTEAQTPNKSYEFYVGSYEQQVLKKAS